MPPKTALQNGRRSEKGSIFALRSWAPPVNHKTFLRVHVQRVSLTPIDLKSGEILQISAGGTYYEDGAVRWWPALAWQSVDPHQNQRVALVSECTRALLGVEFESKVVIRRYKGEIADADKVTVREVFNEVADHTPFMRAGDRDGWRYFLENFLMEAKYVFEGMAFGGVEYKGQKRSFKIEKIADANETPTPIVKRGDPSAAPAVPVYYMTNASTIKLFTDTIPEPVKKAVVVKLPTMPAAPATPTRTSTPTRPQVSTSDEPKPKISIPAGSVKKAKSKAPPPRTAASNVTFDSIGGLSTQIDSLKTLLTSVLEDAEEFSRKGLVPPRGILLYGPPGTGKTLMLKAAASEIKAKSYILDGSVMGKYMGESEASIRKIFAEARKNQPSIIFMDEVDSLAPKRGQGEGSDSEGRIVSTLLTEMDGIEDGTSMRVAVVAATNRPNAIDPALRRAGRFEKELEIGIPDVEARRQILTLLMRKLDFESDSGKSKEEFITALAARTHGYVGADLEAVIRGGFSLALKRRRETAAREIQLTAGTAPAAGEDASMLRSAPAVLEDVPSMVRDAPATIGDSPAVAEDSPTTAPDTPDAEFILTASIATLAITPTPVKDIALNESDVERALKEVKPTAMREIFIEPPTVRWSDIGGQEEVKQALREAVEWPLTHPEVFARLGGTPRKGLLLYGPPGCSKTLTAKALATEAGLNFMAVKGPELFSMYVGESERAVREIFRKARAASPSIIFFDEIDALSASREGGKGGGANVLTALLNEMDGIETLKNVIVLAATNRPEIIDPALMRPGRLDTILYVGPPDLDARREILKIKTRKMAVAADVDINLLAQHLDGFSGAEIVNICDEAIHYAMRESFDIEAVARKHFEMAVTKAVPQITKSMRKKYEEWSVGGVKRI